MSHFPHPSTNHSVRSSMSISFSIIPPMALSFDRSTVDSPRFSIYCAWSSVPSPRSSVLIPISPSSVHCPQSSVHCVVPFPSHPFLRPRSTSSVLDPPSPVLKSPPTEFGLQFPASSPRSSVSSPRSSIPVLKSRPMCLVPDPPSPVLRPPSMPLSISRPPPLVT